MVKENTYITIQAFMVNELQLKGNELLIMQSFMDSVRTEKGNLPEAFNILQIGHNQQNKV